VARLNQISKLIISFIMQPYVIKGFIDIDLDRRPTNTLTHINKRTKAAGRA
jgi:hypothetical protein